MEQVGQHYVFGDGAGLNESINHAVAMVQKGGSSTRLIEGVLRPYCMFCMGQYFAGNQYLFVDVTKTHKAQEQK
eukprot:12929117-Prorocentrum_lima.AAC.1